MVEVIESSADNAGQEGGMHGEPSTRTGCGKRQPGAASSRGNTRRSLRHPFGDPGEIYQTRDIVRTV